MDVKITLVGVKEIDDVLKGLPLQLNHRVMQAAHSEAAKPLINKAKLVAPEGPTGNLIDSIGTVKPSFSRAGQLGEISVGPRRGRYKGYAGHLVEYGKRNRGNKGMSKAKPFMQPAFTTTKDEVMNGINDAVGKKLYSFMKRTIK